MSRKKREREEAVEESASAGEVDISELKEGIERQTARRSDLYRLLSAAFAFPTDALCDAIRAGDVRAALDQAAAGLPYAFEGNGSAPALADIGDAEGALEVAYIRFFDVGGGGGPPCSLYTGNWTGDRLRAMEECLRFYEHFGLGLPDPKPDLPDHLCVTLEFLHYLTFRQVEAEKAGEGSGDYVRAQRDFLDRQVLSWFPRMAEKLGGTEPHPFYASLVVFALAFFEHEKAYLKRIAAPPA